jgi:hypothetical protein
MKQKQTDKWENPYWKDQGLLASEHKQQQDKPWKNPYWKDDKMQDSIGMEQQQTNKWENPYWSNSGSNMIPKSASRNNEQRTNSRQHSYGDDSSQTKFKATQRSTIGNQNGHKRTQDNLWNTDSASLSESKIPSIPDFYQQIFPASASSSSLKRTATETNGNQAMGILAKQSTRSVASTPRALAVTDSKQDNALPFTIDGQDVAHFRFYSPSPSSTIRATNFTTGSAIAQQLSAPIPSTTMAIPRSSSNTKSAASIANISFQQRGLPSLSGLSPMLPTRDNALSDAHNHVLSSSATSWIITEQEVNDIQHALRLLEVNPNSIPTIDASQLAPKNIDKTRHAPYTALGSVFPNVTRQTAASHLSPIGSLGTPIIPQSSSPFLSGSYSPQVTKLDPSASNYSSNLNNILDRLVKPEPIIHI